MFESPIQKLELSIPIQQRLQSLREQMAESGIDISMPDSVPTESVVAYSYAWNYKLAKITDQIVVCDAYAQAMFGRKPIHFLDAFSAAPGLRELFQLASQGAIKAVIFKDVETFSFCKSHNIADCLTPFRDAGVEIHFASAFEKMLNGASLCMPANIVRAST